MWQKVILGQNWDTVHLKCGSEHTVECFNLGLCDIVVGEPSKRELFNLKASLEAYPYPFQIPYTISDEFKAGVHSITQALMEGKPVEKTCIFGGSFNRFPFISIQRMKDQLSPDLSQTRASDKKNVKWAQYSFIIGGILLILAIIVYVIY